MARHRTAEGKPAHSINLGAVSDVGYVAEQGEAATELISKAVMADILPIIRGKSEILNEGNLTFTNLELITNKTIVDVVPDWYDGSHVKEISKIIR